MTRYMSIIFAALLVFAFLPACDEGGNGGDADQETTPDQPTEDAVHEDVTGEDVAQEETPGDPPAEDVIIDTPEEEAAGCPADNPPDEVYINVDGTVRSLDGTTSVADVLTAAISPMDALLNPTPIHLMEDTVAADGLFAFDCLNVGEVDIGLVVLADDSGAGTDWYPTGTGIEAWGTPPVKEDITGAIVFAVPETMATALQLLTSMNFDATGVAMGLIVDETTGNPIDGAEVVRSPSGTLNVVYPNATMDGLEADGDTSAIGAFIITDELTTITTLTVNATGYTFEVHQAATKAEFIYFLLIPGTPA